MSNSERGGGEAIVKSVPSMHVQLLCRLQNYENIGDVSKNSTHSGKLHNIVYLFISYISTCRYFYSGVQLYHPNAFQSRVLHTIAIFIVGNRVFF